MIETPFIARQRKANPFAGIAFVVVIAVLGAWFAGALAGLGWASPIGEGTRWFGWAMVGMAALTLFWLVRGWQRDEFLFRLDHQGVTVPGWNEHTIPWSAVTDVTKWQTRQTSFLMLTLADPSQFPGKGLLGKMNFADASGGHVPLAAAMSDRSEADVLAAIDYFRKWNGRGDPA